MHLIKSLEFIDFDLNLYELVLRFKIKCFGGKVSKNKNLQFFLFFFVNTILSYQLNFKLQF